MNQDGFVPVLCQWIKIFRYTLQPLYYTAFCHQAAITFMHFAQNLTNPVTFFKTPCSYSLTNQQMMRASRDWVRRWPNMARKEVSREVFFFPFYPALNQDTPDVSPWGVELALTSVIAKFHFGELIGRKHWQRYGVWWLSDRKTEKREDGKRIHGGFHFQLVWVLLWRAKILSIIGPDCDSFFSLSDYFSSHSLFLLLYLFFSR